MNIERCISGSSVGCMRADLFCEIGIREAYEVALGGHLGDGQLLNLSNTYRNAPL